MLNHIIWAWSRFITFSESVSYARSERMLRPLKLSFDRRRASTSRVLIINSLSWAFISAKWVTRTLGNKTRVVQLFFWSPWSFTFSWSKRPHHRRWIFWRICRYIYCLISCWSRGSRAWQFFCSGKKHLICRPQLSADSDCCRSGSCNFVECLEWFVSSWTRWPVLKR